MAVPFDILNTSSEMSLNDADGSNFIETTDAPSLSASPPDNAILDTPTLGPSTPKSPRLSRNPSFSGSSSYQEDWDAFPPLDRLTVLDILDNFALPQQLEKLQKGISAQTEKVRRSREAFKSKSHHARERMVEEWRRRVPSAEEQLDRYRKRMRISVDKLGKQWNNTKGITLREKISFICGVMNIFLSGYLIGGFAEYFHIWYTVQLIYFMPIRVFTYHRRNFHYFLADLCYFVNMLLMLSIWVLPNSKRLFTATYCLAYGNNAIAIIMWRNSLVFHSFDKVTSLFIHIMPCATLHCIVHLWDEASLATRFPAVWTIKHSPPGSPTAYGNIVSMLAWSTIPYAVWQLSYYFLITVRRREKIEAGLRQTSFTWLRRSYSKSWIGKIVLSLPDKLQEPAFMMIQYSYAILTMLPCPIWFFNRYASAAFLMVVFTWSIYNGATFYIDVFGKRFQKELEAMKAEVTKWQSSTDLTQSPLITPSPEGPILASLETAMGNSSSVQNPNDEALLGPTAAEESKEDMKSVDRIPLLNAERAATTTATQVDGRARDLARERKSGGMD